METEKLKDRVEKLESKHKKMTIGLFVHDIILIALSVAVSYFFLDEGNFYRRESFNKRVKAFLLKMSSRDKKVQSWLLIEM